MNPIRLFARCPVPLGLLLILTVLAASGCAMREEEGEEGKKPPPPAVQPSEKPAKVVPEQPVQPPVAPLPDLGPEPDWKLRAREMAVQLAKKFKPAQPGTNIEVKLMSDAIMKGKLLAIDGSSIVLELAQGEITLERADIDHASRRPFWAVDAVTPIVLKKLNDEKVAWQRKKIVLERQRAQAAVADPSRPVRPKLPEVVNRPPDGRVSQVVEYLRENSRNPASIRFLEWGKVQRNDRKGYKVRLKFQADGGELGVITVHKVFLLDMRGRVYRTTAYREGITHL